MFAHRSTRQVQDLQTQIAELTQAPEDLKEDFIHSLQKQVEVDEPEAEVVPALASPSDSVQPDAPGDGQFDRMTMDASLSGPEAREGWEAFRDKRAPDWVPEDLRTGRL